MLVKKNYFKALFAGLLLFFGVVLAVTHWGELNHFLLLLSNLAPLWILIALLLQCCTYIALALVWYQALAESGSGYPMHRLVPLALARLFADQALPSGGISGIALVVNAFRERNVSAKTGMDVMLLTIFSFYAAYIIAVGASMLLLWSYLPHHQWIVVTASLFFLFALAVPAAILLLKAKGIQELPGWLLRVPVIAGFTETFADPSVALLRKPLLLLEATVFQLLIFLFDAATLWAMLQALGEEVSLLVAFPCFVIASIVAMLSFIPLGIGTFEASSVALLVMLGIQIEPALAATLLLRGFTLWLPMIPGLILIRTEFR